LVHFEEDVEHGEIEQAGPDLLTVLITSTIDVGTELLIDEIAGKVPGGPTFAKIMRNVATELENKVDTSRVSILGFVQKHENDLLILRQSFDANLEDTIQEELEPCLSG
jgi:hypothetical protein